jgi:hypothetical protein
VCRRHLIVFAHIQRTAATRTPLAPAKSLTLPEKREPHKPKVGGSTPPPATSATRWQHTESRFTICSRRKTPKSAGLTQAVDNQRKLYVGRRLAARPNRFDDFASLGDVKFRGDALQPAPLPALP